MYEELLSIRNQIKDGKKKIHVVLSGSKPDLNQTSFSLQSTAQVPYTVTCFCCYCFCLKEKSYTNFTLSDGLQHRTTHTFWLT